MGEAGSRESGEIRLLRAMAVLLPFYLALVLSHDREALGNGPRRYEMDFWQALWLTAISYPVWIGLLEMPRSWKGVAVATWASTIYILLFAGLMALVSAVGLFALPVYGVGFLLIPLLLAARQRPSLRGWIEAIADIMRRGLLRGLGALGAALITVAILQSGSDWLETALFGRGFHRGQDGEWYKAASFAGVAAATVTVSLLLAWEEWTEPLIRRLWALLLPLLLILGLSLAVSFLVDGNTARYYGWLPINMVLTSLAASLLFAAGTRQNPGRLVRWARLAALPIALSGLWLLGRRLQQEGWSEWFFYQMLVASAVLFASLRVWIVQLRPGIWLPEGLVTMALPLIALLAGAAVPKVLDVKPYESAVQMVWPLNAPVPEGLRQALNEKHGRRCSNELCRVILQDIDGDGDPEALELTANTILKRQATGEWYLIGYFKKTKSDIIEGSGDVIERRTITYGDRPVDDIQSVAPVEAEYKDLLVNGERLKLRIY